MNKETIDDFHTVYCKTSGIEQCLCDIKKIKALIAQQNQKLIEEIEKLRDDTPYLTEHKETHFSLCNEFINIIKNK